ncbi:MAG: type II secretion system F family protein, partial [Pseudomonadota bacterium]
MIVLKSVLSDIDNGIPLYKALARNKSVFDAFYVSLVRVGEESGNLEKNLEYLAQQLKRSYDFKKKIQGAMMYPEIV